MRIKLDEGAIRPVRAHETDAGLDLYALRGGLVRAQQATTFHTGVHAELPDGTVGILMPKSGMMTRHDLLTFGVVDEGYTGEIMVHIFNCGSEDYSVRAGDKISQMLIVPVRYENVEIVEEIGGGARGDCGFGSTGR
jgi:dUTP pyrophosphatase